nr:MULTISPECIES: DUF559 domain-containing protein [unclassified Herbaspirillum]
MNWQFTPIENSVWSDIRIAGIPFFPQVPALNYFLDFACPFLKIGIECDGKAWHDSQLDAHRDKRLAEDGWMIFRIEGHECRRVIEAFPEYEESEFEDIYNYFMTTSEGIVSAIRQKYFEDRATEKYSDLIEQTLFNHRSTPETFPMRLLRREQTAPINSGDALEDYLEEIFFRSRKTAA